MADPPGESAAPFPAPRRSELRLRAQALLLLETAMGDSALGCHNRAYLVHRARDEVARRSRYGQRLSVLLVGTEGACGKHEGALKELVAVIRLALRPTDTFARWQPGEFVILLPCTGLAGATRLARRLASLLTSAAGRTGLPVDALIGLATAMGRHEGLELLIQRARNGVGEARAAGSRIGIG
ncbi:MAG: GGDEF domain-containing protein [Geminicoccaceae bacterium]